MLNLIFLTIFPELFPGTLGISNPKNAMNTAWNYNIVNIKDFGLTKHKNVDDTPFGGGAGMVLRADVLGNAIDFAIKNYTDSKNYDIIITSAKGMIFNQKVAQNYSNLSIQNTQTNKNFGLIIICGRFEGIDQRVIDFYHANEFRIGNYVLFGGEAAAMVMCEAIIRLLPNVCGNDETIHEESFAVGTRFENKLEYPHYTKPRIWNCQVVPNELLSGNHELIKAWKEKNATEICDK